MTQQQAEINEGTWRPQQDLRAFAAQWLAGRELGPEYAEVLDELLADWDVRGAAGG